MKKDIDHDVYVLMASALRSALERLNVTRFDANVTEVREALSKAIVAAVQAGNVTQNSIVDFALRRFMASKRPAEPHF